MKKSLLIIAAALLVVSIAVPAFADVQFLYGGQFRARINSGDNVWDGTDHNGYYGNFATQSFDGLGKPNSYFNSNDNRFFLDQRLRLYFTFVGSKNLKVVTKFEIGDTKWGDPGDGSGALGQRAGQNGGGNIGADQVAIEVKNAYIEFNIPNTPSTALIGVQTLTLLDSWIIDDDFSAAVLLTKCDPFRIAVGYVGGQYGAERRLGTNATAGTLPSGAFSNTYMPYSNQDLNIDDVFVSVDYTCNPFKASLVGFYQDGHKSNVSADRSTQGTPVSAFTGFTDTTFMPVQTNIKSNDLFDLGVNVTYKTDSLLGYVNFVKNFGSVDFNNPVRQVTNGQAASAAAVGATNKTGLNSTNAGLAGSVDTGLPLSSLVNSSDYTGWMVDAGVTYFCPPWTFNVGGFYTTGLTFSDQVAANGTGVYGNNTTAAVNQAETPGRIQTVGGLPFRGSTSTDFEGFTNPIGTGKYTSEIMGGGVLADDIWVLRGMAMGSSAGTKFSGTAAQGVVTPYWESYADPTNVWTVTVGTSWQLCPGTKLSASYWYWGTSNPVPVAFNPNTLSAVVPAGTVLSSSTTAAGVNTTVRTTDPFRSATNYEMSSSLGHELNFYMDQQVVDNLTLTLVAAYMFTGDAFAPLPVGNIQTAAGLNQGTIFGPSHLSTTTTTAAGVSSTVISGNPTATDASKYTSGQAQDAWKLGARLQWNF